MLMLGGECAQHENFANIIHDIALLNSLGVRLVLVHGSRPQIDQRLADAGIDSSFHNGMRITDSDAIDHVKDAAGSLRAQIEALLSMGLPNSPMQGSQHTGLLRQLCDRPAHGCRRRCRLSPDRTGPASRC